MARKPPAPSASGLERRLRAEAAEDREARDLRLRLVAILEHVASAALADDEESEFYRLAGDGRTDEAAALLGAALRRGRDSPGR